MAERILVVDDDKEFRQEFRSCFEEYGVVDAANGVEALQILKKPNEIDLVLLDVMMPGKSGLDILKEIKQTDPQLSIIMLTGYSSKDVAVEALKGHADDYIEKPLDVEKTKETIERILMSKRGEDVPETSDIKGKIERIKRFVEINCYKKVSLSDAAKAVYLSPKYVSRIFKKYTKTDFSEFKLKIKIEKAKELLTKAGYNVNLTSDKLGYENPESLIREFKKLVGYTPAEYKKRHLSVKTKIKKQSKPRVKPKRKKRK